MEPASESDSNDDDDHKLTGIMLVARADNSTTSATRGHVDVDDDGAVLIDGVRIGTKRRCDIPTNEQDQIYETLAEHVSKLARRVKTLETVLQTVKNTVDIVSAPKTVTANNAGSDDVASVDSASCTTLSIGGATEQATAAAPGAVPFVLSPLHPNAYLNRISISVKSWADEHHTITNGSILSSVNEFEFPHRIRWENNGMPSTLWVETFPRRFNLVATLCIEVGGDRIRCTDSAKILHHANKMIPAHMPQINELKFVCYLVYGDAQNGYKNGCRPKTSSKEPLFKNPESCLSLYNGNHIPAFYHTTANKKPVSLHNGTLLDGRIIFKDICFSQQALSSCVLINDGAWRLCIRATHPALTNMLNFSVLTNTFYTGRRVRAVKIKSTEPNADDDAAVKTSMS